RSRRSCSPCARPSRRRSISIASVRSSSVASSRSERRGRSSLTPSRTGKLACILQHLVRATDAPCRSFQWPDRWSGPGVRDVMRVTSHLVLSGFILVTASVAGCGREEPEVPPAAAQSQSTSETERPAMVTGCLRAGDAADTFVLTTSRAEDGTKPVTYHLTGDPGVNLQDHIGE